MLRCLDDTRLESAHVLVGGLPVDGVPLPKFARGCTNGLAYIRRHLLCLLSRLLKLSRQERPDGSGLAYARSDVAKLLSRWLNSYPPDYGAALAFSVLLYPPPHRLALRLAFLYAGLVFGFRSVRTSRCEHRPHQVGAGRRGAYHVPLVPRRRFRPCLSTGGATPTAEDTHSFCAWPLAFWLKPPGSEEQKLPRSLPVPLACSNSRCLSAVHVRWSCRPTLHPSALALAVAASSHESAAIPKG